MQIVINYYYNVQYTNTICPYYMRYAAPKTVGTLYLQKYKQLKIKYNNAAEYNELPMMKHITVIY